MTKKLCVMITAVAMVLLAAGGAFAGTLNPTPVGQINFAIESVQAGTSVTMPTVVYTMGVDRAVGQDFVVIYEIDSGTYTVDPTSIAFTGLDATSYSLTKRRGGVGFSELVYDVDLVSSQVSIGDRLTADGVQIGNTGLTAPGSAVTLSLSLKNDAETAFVDNSAPLTTVWAQGDQAVDFLNGAGVEGIVTDSHTIIDVNYTTPLAGFFPTAPDAALLAASTVQVRTTFANQGGAAPGTAYTTLPADTLTLTVTDASGTNFTGLGTDGLYYDLDADSVADAGEVFTVAGNSATLALAGNTLNLQGAIFVRYPADGTTVLGTSRANSLGGAFDSSIGTDTTLNGLTNWWPWGSNGVQLSAPLIQAPSGWYSRCAIYNSGAVDATYTAAFYTSSGTTATAGSAATGTIPAGESVFITTSDLVTFSGATTRGAAVFTINGPAANFEGVYQLLAPTGTVTNHPMQSSRW